MNVKLRTWAANRLDKLAMRIRLPILHPLFLPFVEPKPIVTCKCGWAGVGVQTKVGGKNGYASDPKCPECKKANNLKWPERRFKMKKVTNK